MEEKLYNIDINNNKIEIDTYQYTIKKLEEKIEEANDR